MDCWVAAIFALTASYERDVQAGITRGAFDLRQMRSPAGRSTTPSSATRVQPLLSAATYIAHRLDQLATFQLEVFFSQLIYARARARVCVCHILML